MPALYGYSPRILPFSPDSRTGFTQNLSLRDVATQNLINLILCCPGERVMHAGFGVGLRNYLFEQNISATRSRIKNKIQSQVAEYLPYIILRAVDFNGTDVDQNLLGIRIIYSIAGTSADRLEPEDVGEIEFMLGGGASGRSITVSYGYSSETGEIYSSTHHELTPITIPDGHTEHATTDPEESATLSTS